MNNIYELLYMVKQKDEYAINQVNEKYIAMVMDITNNLVNRNPHCRGHFEDLKQEGFITLFQCVDNFRDDNNCSFFTYAYLCVERRLKQIVRSSFYDKNRANYQTVSLDQPQTQSGTTIVEMYDQEDPTSDPKYILAYKMAVQRVMEAYGNMSAKDQEVLKAYLRGYSYEKGAEALNISKKTYDYRVQKTKKVIREAIFNEYGFEPLN